MPELSAFVLVVHRVDKKYFVPAQLVERLAISRYRVLLLGRVPRLIHFQLHSGAHVRQFRQQFQLQVRLSSGLSHRLISEVWHRAHQTESHWLDGLLQLGDLVALTAGEVH